MYLKFIISGNLAGTNYGCCVGGFEFYDQNNTKITGLNSTNNLIYDNYNTRNATINKDYWFDLTNGSVPYIDPSNSSTQATIIVNIPINTINQINVHSYVNTSGAKYIDIYYSIDNINYNFSERVSFTSVPQTKQTINKITTIIEKYLIKQNSNYYTINSIYYDSATNHNFTPLTLTGGTAPNKSDIETFGFNDLSVLITNMTVGSDVFIPVTKLNNQFEIKMYKR